MREIPVNDFYVRGGKLREDGRLLHDMYFVQVKTPAESNGAWDYYKIIATIPGDQAFRPAGDECNRAAAIGSSASFANENAQ
jgi:branched-chain amino acid transport system substrate-binding protein